MPKSETKWLAISRGIRAQTACVVTGVASLVWFPRPGGTSDLFDDGLFDELGKFVHLVTLVLTLESSELRWRMCESDDVSAVIYDKIC